MKNVCLFMKAQKSRSERTGCPREHGCKYNRFRACPTFMQKSKIGLLRNISKGTEPHNENQSFHCSSGETHALTSVQTRGIVGLHEEISTSRRPEEGGCTTVPPKIPALLTAVADGKLLVNVLSGGLGQRTFPNLVVPRRPKYDTPETTHRPSSQTNLCESQR